MPITEETLGKVTEEIRHLMERAMEGMRVASEEKLALVREQYEEKIRDLDRQNDGLLSAVGRLQAERDQIAKKLDDKEHQIREEEAKIREHVRELDRKQCDTIRQYDEEIAGYKSRIADLEAKLKKQGKK